ncbi:BglG family transcription antiterminator [Oceanobacillus oncorhynchi]|uniref:BglG family transcription antiterminator n=1 Tax=Oceanobacillus oncorhynchi TaxID=545501 RepID=UPI0021166C14|nr:BglG family transcription antiterminator [Oceanobacillus oncorhynchi]UUI40674.1 BglG family transcription antiterminator [Oceanobacillus oncorhynchi]
MHLDDRSKALIQEIFVNSGLKVKDLSRKYGLSRGQIDYSLKKINDWLEDNEFPLIKKDSRGFFVGDPKHQMLLLKEGKELTPDYIFSSEERALLICFILLTKTEDISLLHLTSELEMSKNTILADLKKAQEIVSFYNLQIHYSRVEGYDIKGDEWNIRRLLLEVIDRIQKISNGSLWIEIYGHLAKEEINRMQGIVEHCESKMQIRFTDEKHNLLPYVFVCIIRRIRRGNMLNNDEIDFSQENVYNIILDLLEMEELISNEDLSFLTLQLLTANLTFSTEPDWSTDTVMMKGLRQMIRNFEYISCTVFLDREELLKKLWLHLKPAYYRIKFGLTQNHKVDEKYFGEVFQDEYKELHHLVKKSIPSLEKVIGCSIPESESIYFTILIGGWMERQGDSLRHRIKAIVVCPNGVSVSKLMKSTLNQLFPEFVFLEALSIREFRKFDIEYDIVFSPVYLDTDKKLFIVEPFISNEVKKQLRSQVMQTVYGFTPQSIDIEELIKIVGNNTDIQNESKLKRELSVYLRREQLHETAIYEEEQPRLVELLQPDHIIIRSEVGSWREAIEIAAQPLLKKGIITPQYIKKMIELHDINRPYIVYGTDIAIPHATPEDGVNDLGMSMLKLQQGVNISSNQSIRLIVVIAPIDKKKHLRALLEISKLSELKPEIEEIIKAVRVEDIYHCLEDYSNQEKLQL